MGLYSHTAAQRLFWMAAEGLLVERFRSSPLVADAVAPLLPAVARGELTPRAGAERAVARFLDTDVLVH